MEKCEYFDKCGTPGVYECEHSGYMPEDSSSYGCPNEVRLKLEEAAAEMQVWDESEDERRFKENHDLAEIMKLEFTV